MASFLDPHTAALVKAAAPELAKAVQATAAPVTRKLVIESVGLTVEETKAHLKGIIYRAQAALDALEGK